MTRTILNHVDNYEVRINLYWILKKYGNMNKITYFVVQAIWSLIVSVLIWYAFFCNSAIGPNPGSSDDSFAGIILFVGALIYLILTVLYIILGHKKIKGWSRWMIIVSLCIAVIIGFLGSQAVIYGTEWIGSL